MICVFNSCRCASLAVVSCIPCIDVHTSRSTVVSITLMFMFRPCHDSQSVKNSSGPGLYSMHSMHLYWCISRICFVGIVIMLPHLAQ